eukprot:scaffold682175_cov60-Prasinocladus_malaysianus.AAC.1
MFVLHGFSRTGQQNTAPHNTAGYNTTQQIITHRNGHQKKQNKKHKIIYCNAMHLHPAHRLVQDAKEHI